MREALELWEKYQPESAAEYFKIVHQKGLKEGFRDGYRDGLQEGYPEGQQDAQQKSLEQVAERMIGKGVTDTDIHVFTQLSLDEIAKLRNDLSG